MFDFEKMMKPVFEKYVPTIVAAFEKNKKKDYLMRVCLEKHRDFASLDTFIKTESEAYEKCLSAVEKELNSENQS